MCYKVKDLKKWEHHYNYKITVESLIKYRIFNQW